MCRCFASLVGWSLTRLNFLSNFLKIENNNTDFLSAETRYFPKTKAKPTRSRSHKVSPPTPHIHIRRHHHITSHPTYISILKANIPWQTGYATTTCRPPTAIDREKLEGTIVWRDRKTKKCPDSHHLQGRGGMGRGGQRGGSSSQRGGGGRHGGPQGPQPTLDKPKREAILDLAKYANARIRVKFTGGREGMSFFIQSHPADGPRLT